MASLPVYQSGDRKATTPSGLTVPDHWPIPEPMEHSRYGSVSHEISILCECSSVHRNSLPKRHWPQSWYVNPSSLSLNFSNGACRQGRADAGRRYETQRYGARIVILRRYRRERQHAHYGTQLHTEDEGPVAHQKFRTYFLSP